MPILISVSEKKEEISITWPDSDINTVIDNLTDSQLKHTHQNFELFIDIKQFRDVADFENKVLKGLKEEAYKHGQWSDTPKTYSYNVQLSEENNKKVVSDILAQGRLLSKARNKDLGLYRESSKDILKRILDKQLSSEAKSRIA